VRWIYRNQRQIHVAYLYQDTRQCTLIGYLPAQDGNWLAIGRKVGLNAEAGKPI
jgi:hypothetical protein